MSNLAKLTLKNVIRTVKLSPTEVRRHKLLKTLEEQLEVAEAAVRGEQYTVTVPKWVKNEQGERVAVKRQRVVRAWFFERDGGVYVQCKYGSKALALGKDSNAVFVPALADVKGALEALYAAVSAGELDAAIAEALAPKQKRKQ